MAASMVGVAVLGLVFVYRSNHAKPAAPVHKTGRLFARATSEDGAAWEIKLDRQPQELLVTPDGKKIYSIDQTSNTLTVLDGASYRVKNVITLPSAQHCATMSHDGKRIYAGSMVDGVMEVDTEQDRVLERIIPTGGPVQRLAVTPDGKKLFVAMLAKGLKVIYPRTGETKLLSGITCPFYLGIDREGRELYVSYQCGGPGGRSGHDAVETYDVDSERSLGIIGGSPPLVGGDLSFAPDGTWVWLNGGDACLVPEYDHTGCPFVPSIVYHLIRTSDHKIVKTIGRPGLPGSGVFTPDGGRVVLSGDSLLALDPLKEKVSERFARRGEFYGKVAFMPAGDRAIIPVEPAGILVLDGLDTGCLPPAEGLYNLYSGDGTLDDEQQVNSLKAEGGVGFAPGLIGQAFHFNGEDALLRARSEGACGGCGPSWSASLYVKFSELQGEMSILDRVREDNSPEIRLRRSSEERIVLEVADRDRPGQAVSTSEPISAGKWHHIAVVTDKGAHSLYVDGSKIGRIQTPPLSPEPFRGLPVGTTIGATHDRTSFLSGLVDELAFYNRAFSAAEIKGMYELSVHSPCRLAQAR
jgi:YVTN family beta-propeller protein